MGNWRADQSKGVRRYVWQQTRGEHDDTFRDVAARMKAFPVFTPLRIEKIGSEIHVWRQIKEDSGKTYWASCFRLVDDGWGYWTVFYRPDERRWRTTPIKDEPIGKALAHVAEFYQEAFSD
jgi:hypothetical protein